MTSASAGGRPSSGCASFIGGVIGWYVGLGLLLLVIFGFDVVVGEASLPWDLGGTSLTTIIGVALLVIAALLAPMVYFGSRTEARKRSGDGAATTGDEPAWWSAPAIVAAVGAGVLAVERAPAYGITVGMAIGLLLLLIAAVTSTVGYLSSRLRRAAPRGGDAASGTEIPWWAPAVVFGPLGGVLLVIERATAYGATAWVAIGLLLLPLAVVVGWSSHRQDKRIRARPDAEANADDPPLSWLILPTFVVWLSATIFLVLGSLHLGISLWLTLGGWLLISIAALVAHSVIEDNRSEKRKLAAKRAADKD